MGDSPLFISKLIFAGIATLMLLYGVYLTLTVICIHYIFTNRSRNWILLSYLIVSLLVSTMFLAASGKYTELILLESAVHPETVEKIGLRLELLQEVAYSVKIWLADSLLIYRLYIIWLGSFVVIAVPSVLFCGSLATGIAGLGLFRHVSQAKQNRDLGVAFHSCSVALNVITTSLIAGRLLYQRKKVAPLGEEHGRQYLSLLAVFAESGAIYSIAGLIYIPLYAQNSNLVFVFAAVVEAAAGIAPALIVLRMALGVAVSQKTQRQLSTLRFDGQRVTQGKEGDELSTYNGVVSTLSANHPSGQHLDCKDSEEHVEKFGDRTAV